MWGFNSKKKEQDMNYRSNSVSSEKQHATSVVIYKSEFDYISRCILDYKNIETGGQLFGLWSNTGVPVVLYAIGPGARANHQPAFFNQEMNYLTSVGGEIVRRYGLQHIGEWHSHHQLGLAKPSGHDASNISRNMHRSRLRRFLLAIGNCTNTNSTLNAYTFHELDPSHYVHAAWDIKQMESPYRRLIDNELRNILCHPYTQNPSHGDIFMTGNISENYTTPDYGVEYWLNDKSNNIELKNILDFLNSMNQGDWGVQLDTNSHVHLTNSNNISTEKIYFPERFPVEQPFIKIERDLSCYIPDNSRVVWNYTGNITESFKQYYIAFKTTYLE